MQKESTIDLASRTTHVFLDDNTKRHVRRRYRLFSQRKRLSYDLYIKICFSTYLPLETRQTHLIKTSIFPSLILSSTYIFTRKPSHPAQTAQIAGRYTFLSLSLSFLKLHHYTCARRTSRRNFLDR